MIVVMSSPDPRRWYPGRRGMRSAVHIGQLTDVLWLQFAAVFVMQLARGGLVSSPALPDSSDTRWPSRPGQLAPALPGTAANVMGVGRGQYHSGSDQHMENNLGALPRTEPGSPPPRTCRTWLLR